MRGSRSLPHPEIDCLLTDYCRDMGYGELAVYMAAGEDTGRLAGRSSVHTGVDFFPKQIHLDCHDPVARSITHAETAHALDVQEKCPNSWPAKAVGKFQDGNERDAELYWKAFISIPIPSPDSPNQGAIVVLGKRAHVPGMYTFFDQHDEAQIAVVGSGFAQLHAVALTRQRELSSTTMVGHEVRNVLTTLTYALETVYSKVASLLVDRTQSTREVIEEQINLLTFLAHNDDLITNPDWELHEETVGLHGDVVAHIVEMMNAFARHKRMRIIFSNLIDKGVPRFRLDRHRMEQVIYNLLSNTIKYGDMFSQVDIVYREVRELPCGDAQEVKPCHIFCVRNKGIGVRQDEAERVFLLFERGTDAPSASLEGQGKGLTVARMIMRKHGGDVWFESLGGKDQWTEVGFAIPVERVVGR